jgi:hypothetical protein
MQPCMCIAVLACMPLAPRQKSQRPNPSPSPSPSPNSSSSSTVVSWNSVSAHRDAQCTKALPVHVPSCYWNTDAHLPCFHCRGEGHICKEARAKLVTVPTASPTMTTCMDGLALDIIPNDTSLAKPQFITSTFISYM